MPASTHLDFLKIANAALRENTGNPVITQAQLGKLQEIQQYITWQGGNPSLWDYPQGQVVLNASSANGRSSVFDIGHEAGLRRPVLVRIVSTVGTTPTATVAIQGSSDSQTWNNVPYADYQSPGSFSSSNLTITTAGTVIKLIAAGTSVRYLSVNVTADTNVTNTIDISFLG